MSYTTVLSPTKGLSPKKFSSPTKAIRLIKATSPKKKAYSPRKVRFPRRAVPGKSCLKKASACSPSKKATVSSPSKARSPKPTTKNVTFATPSKIQVLIIPAENRGRTVKHPHTSIRLLSPVKQRFEGVEEQVQLAKVRTSATKKLKRVLKVFRSWKQAGVTDEERMSEIYDHLNRLGKSCTEQERSLLKKPVQTIIFEIERLAKEEKEFQGLMRAAEIKKKAQDASERRVIPGKKKEPGSLGQRRTQELVGMAKVQKQVRDNAIQQAVFVNKDKPKDLERNQKQDDELVKGLTKQFQDVKIGQTKQPGVHTEANDGDSLRVLMAAEEHRKASPPKASANVVAETKLQSPPETTQASQKIPSADEDDGRPKWWHPIFFLVMLILIWGSRHD